MSKAIPPTTTRPTAPGTIFDFQSLISRLFLPQPPTRANPASSQRALLHDGAAPEDHLHVAARIRLELCARLAIENDLRRVARVVVRPAVFRIFRDDLLRVVR